MRAHFRPEFLNRVDEIVLFKPLTFAEIKKIVDLQLGLLRQRLAERHIQLELSEAAKELSRARGLRSGLWGAAAQAIPATARRTALSRKLLTGELTDHQRVVADFKRGELIFKATPLNSAEVLAA